MTAREPVLIAGTGALASLFAAKLAATGQPVVMLGSWLAAITEIRRHGVRLIHRDGKVTTHPVRTILDPAGVSPIRRALVLRKSWQTCRAARELDRCLAPHGVAVTLQNGIGNAETLTRVLGSSRVGAGATTTPARIVSPGVVRATGSGTVTLEDRPEIASLAEALKAAGFTVESSSNVPGLLWGKLVVSAAINPLTALLGTPNGHLLQDPGLESLALQIGHETAAVASRRGITLPYPDPATAIQAVLRQTAANHSSMLQDVLRGAPTEIEAICGAVVAAGRETGAATPLNEALHHLVTACALAAGRVGVSGS